MRRSRLALAASLGGSVILLHSDGPLLSAGATSPPRPDVTAPAGRGIELGFELNEGQLDARVRYAGRFGGLNVLFRDDGPSLTLRAPSSVEPPRTLHFRIPGGSFSRPSASRALAAVSNYFLGSAPSQWRTKIPNYAVVTYPSVLAGIDLRFHANEGRLEFDFVVAPGASPRSIELRIEGADRLALTDEGDLEVHAAGRTLVQRRPRLIQTIGGSERPVVGAYRLVDDATVAFEIGPFDAEQPLLIDPVLEYSTYFGGKASDRGGAIAVDSLGNVYVTGYTASSDLPTQSPFQASLAAAGNDAYVAKINAAGTALVYSTYLGGSSDDRASSIAVDASGDAYVVGSTSSSNFPVANAIQSSYGGVADAFVTKLDPSGSALVYSTYLGGPSDDRASAIALDASGNAYVTGVAAAGFPIKNAFQPTFGGAGWDAFVAKLDASGTSLSYSTFLGGSNQDQGDAVAVDAQGSAFVTGSTFSTDFPTLNPFQASCSSTCASLYDAFVTKLGPAGNALVYSTYLGGTGEDYATGIGVDALGNAYVTGETRSKDFPTQNALQPNNAGGGNGDDDFVTKLSPAGNALVYSTYLGGNQDEFGGGLAVDPAGDAFISGTTLSSNFPTQNAVQTSSGGNYDAYLTVLPPTGSGLAFSSFIGGSGGDFGGSVALDSSGKAFITGYTQSSDFPTKGAIQNAPGGLDDAFVVAIGGLPNVYDAGGPDAGMQDAATLDASSDAERVDAAADGGGPSPSGTAGCSCETAGVASDGSSLRCWPFLAALAGLGLRRRRSIQRPLGDVQGM